MSGRTLLKVLGIGMVVAGTVCEGVSRIPEISDEIKKDKNNKVIDVEDSELKKVD